MIKWLIKAAIVGIVAYLVITFPGTVADLAADAVATVRDTAVTMFQKID